MPSTQGRPMIKKYSLLTLLAFLSAPTFAENQEPCGQSPINLKTAYEVDVHDIKYTWPVLEYTVTSDGHTITGDSFCSPKRYPKQIERDWCFSKCKYR
jgi:hypothetical protein